MHLHSIFQEKEYFFYKAIVISVRKWGHLLRFWIAFKFIKRKYECDTFKFRRGLKINIATKTKKRFQKTSLAFMTTYSLADPRGGARDARPSWGSKFFHFHVVFGKNVKNNSNFGSWRPPRGKSWTRHCY